MKLKDNTLNQTDVIIKIDEKNLNRLKHATGLVGAEESVHYAVLKFIEMKEHQNGVSFPSEPFVDKSSLD
jgi:hypothetical protein